MFHFNGIEGFYGRGVSGRSCLYRNLFVVCARVAPASAMAKTTAPYLHAALASTSIKHANADGTPMAPQLTQVFLDAPGQSTKLTEDEPEPERLN